MVFVHIIELLTLPIKGTQEQESSHENFETPYYLILLKTRVTVLVSVLFVLYNLCLENLNGFCLPRELGLLSSSLSLSFSVWPVLCFVSKL